MNGISWVDYPPGLSKPELSKTGYVGCTHSLELAEDYFKIFRLLVSNKSGSYQPIYYTVSNPVENLCFGLLPMHYVVTTDHHLERFTDSEVTFNNEHAVHLQIHNPLQLQKVRALNELEDFSRVQFFHPHQLKRDLHLSTFDPALIISKSIIDLAYAYFIKAALAQNMRHFMKINGVVVIKV